MSGAGDSRGRKDRIDAAAKARFMAALGGGARREEAAAAGGFTLDAFYRARRRDPEFKAAWTAALAAAPRSPVRACDPAETRIAPANARRLQRRRMPHARFDEERRKRFLAHFAWSCDTRAAAAEAGVSEATVYNHRRNDPAFAGEFEATLASGYLQLEAELLRQRLAAQRALRSALEEAEPGSATVPAEAAAEFDRVLKLLARRDRQPRRPDTYSSSGGRRRVWTFDAAIELLDKRLKALDIPVPPLSPDLAGRYDRLPEDNEPGDRTYDPDGGEGAP